jgi:hypothetical protein
MAQMNGLTRQQVNGILTIAIVTAAGIWISVVLQTVGLSRDAETRENARAVCVAIATSYNVQLQRQRRDTVPSPLDSLPEVECRI